VRDAKIPCKGGKEHRPKILLLRVCSNFDILLHLLAKDLSRGG
jgi:hypothetical protein